MKLKENYKSKSKKGVIPMLVIVIAIMITSLLVTIQVMANDKTTLYDIKGNTKAFRNSIIEEQLTVGWYREPQVFLYAEDGRCVNFSESQVEGQLTVGWYRTSAEAQNARLKRESDYINSKITQSDINILADVMHSEANGLATKEVAMVAWCILNRFDNGWAKSIYGVATAKGQFTRRGNTKKYSWLAKDVLTRYYKEKLGYQDVGRVLPKDYFYFTGRNGHNYFRKTFKGSRTYQFNLKDPYTS